MKLKEKNFISAVLYIHHEEEIIGEFLSGLISLFESHFKKFEIICVNDDSTDDSLSIIHNVTNIVDNGIISIVNMSYYQGLEASMNAGVDLAIGDYVFEFDNIGFDFDTGLIMEVYHHSLSGYDIVAASGKKNRISSMIFYSIFNRNAHMQYELHNDTFRILSRRAINRIHSMSKTIPYRKALYANCGLQMDTLFYQPLEIFGKEKKEKNVQKRLTTAFDSLILFTNITSNISVIFAILMMIVTLLGVIYTVIIYFLGQPVAGYTTTMIVMTAGFFGVFTIFAVVIKYLSVIVSIVFNEQKYLVKSVEKVSKTQND